MQTLRKKTSPLKYKNETTRFLGDGVSFKAKLIGILEVSEARGDRMCQEALSDLKMAIRAAGEHKQRITINIAIDGLRLRDEKTGDSLYHHPVHKISFIAQDMSDSRAFGYIFGSPDTGHRFFGIKTDKAASQVVIAMRDLFQVVFALKKKEIELAKQHLDKTRYTSSPLFTDSSISSTNKLQTISQEATKSTSNDASKTTGTSAEAKSGGTAVADLVDLELELNSLQQGLNQMERITPSDPFSSKDDPFGDSFTSYTKPILPPPPSSGRERSSRTSESSSVFSPRTPHNLGGGSLDATSSADVSLISSRDLVKSKKDFSFSHEFNSSHEEPSSGDWFTPSAGNSIFEEPPLVPPVEPTKDEKHEMTKQEILSQFDVFTELDPLGTGRSKPYIDKKHFFQELKNPPKKVLNDLVSQTQSHQSSEPSLFTTTNKTVKPLTTDFTTDDPFGEDPFVTEDPFAETDFAKPDDPFESDFAPKLGFDTFKFDGAATNRKDFYQAKLSGKLMQLHENPSLDMSSESECAPEPPPRPPSSTLLQIKPPPLPPKKQANDLAVKPPPRPPSSQQTHEDSFSHYDYMDHYETAPSSLEFVRTLEKSPPPPPLPVPARKARFESDFAPERPRKPLNNDEDNEYLTPVGSAASGVLLPPPSKKNISQQVTVASYLESKPHLTTSMAAVDNLNCSLEGLDITLSQLTLSGLNELATKLNIPTNQLSNMTLVQLTNFLSNFIKAKNEPPPPTNLNITKEANSNEFPAFKADFAANFNNLNNTTATVNQDPSSYDRYAVFRELINEEIKQTKIDTEPEEIQQEVVVQKEEVEVVSVAVSPTPPDLTTVNNLNKTEEDKYAALREIVETEMKQSVSEPKDDNKNESNEENLLNDEEKIVDTNIINIENKIISEHQEKNTKYNNLIEYNSTIIEKEEKNINAPLKSPTIKTNSVKSPVPIAITEIMQNNARLTSGSLSDVVSGSSPEVDNTGSNSEKKANDATGESWAIFDQGNNGTVVTESIKEKQAVQSEEGVSPWSSDSKEFGNGSPPEWRGNERWPRRKTRRDQEGWWDTSAEPEVQYYPPSNMRSTDSYEEEYYECYDRPRRRKQPGYSQASAAGGHSSSSRDVSPWEEEPRRRPGWRNHPRGQHSFEKHRDRRYTDSWDDEEDDYEYEDEHPAGRFHRGGDLRHSREMERERHSSGSREHDWGDDWSEERRHRRRRDERWCCPDWDQDEHDKHPPRYGGSGRWASNPEGPGGGMWRDRKHDDRYYSRESQESPWEDEYSNEPEESLSSHYLAAKRNWKRPSSASEMDRKTGEIKSRHYLGTGGSDGERDRRYKPSRRSRSRDSQYSEPTHRHKPDPIGGAPRGPHRNIKYGKPQFETDFTDVATSKKQLDSKPDHSSNKKSATLANRKKKESPKGDESVVSVNTFPRKGSSRAKSLFENDFVPSEESPPINVRVGGAKFNFENDFETSEAESPTTLVNKQLRGLRQQSMFESKTESGEFSKENYRQRSLKETRVSPRLQNKPKSLFEDDFSPSDNKPTLPEDNSISSIKEEIDPNEEDDSFSTNNFENSATNSRKKKFNKHRLSNNCDANLKKSESVNIFARESDPFDDDFFSENAGDVLGMDGNGSPSNRTTDLKWTDDFEDFDIKERK